MLKYYIILLFSIGIGLFSISEPAKSENIHTNINTLSKHKIILASFAYFGKEDTYNRYKPIVDYLNKILVNEEIELRVLSMEEIYEGVERKQIDLVTTNPVHFLIIRHKYNLSGAIATLVNKSFEGYSSNQFGGVIVAKADRRDINTLEDLRGKRIATPDLQKMGGYLAPLYELSQNGIEIGDIIENVEESGIRYRAMELLMNDSCDAIFVRTGVVEELVEKGYAKLEDLKIINKIDNADFPYLLSTELYPEWPIFALPYVDESRVRHIASALFALDPDDDLMRESGFYGYTIPADYLPVEKILQELRLSPYDDPPMFNFTDIYTKYKNEFLFILALLLFTVVIAIVYFRSSIRINNEKKKYHNLLSGMGEGVIGINIEGNCIFINDVGKELLGLTEDEILNHKLSIIIYRDPNKLSKKDLNTMMDEVIKNGETNNCDAKFLRKNGEIFDVDVIISPYVENNENVGAIISFRDVTIEKKNLDEIRKLSRALDQNPVAVFIANNRGRIEYVNQSFIDSIGYTFEEIKGKLPELLYSDYLDRGTVDEIKDRLLNKEVWRGKLRSKRRNGTIMWESAIFAPMLNDDNEITNFIGIREDITEAELSKEVIEQYNIELESAYLQLAEKIKQLEKNEKKLSDIKKRQDRILEIAPVGIAISDDNGNLIEINKSFEHIIGAKRADILKEGDITSDRGLINKDGSKVLVQDYPGYVALRERKPVRNRILGWTEHNGTVVWLSISAIPLDIEGAGVIVTLNDITTLVLAELELKEINEALIFSKDILEDNQYLLNSTIAELEQSRVELEELNSTKDKFFSVIAHDLRSPFSGFLGLTRELSENIQYMENNEIQEMASSLKDSADNLLKLLENLLEWAIIQKGNKVIQPEYSNLYFLANHNVEIFKAMREDKKLTIELDIDGTLEVYADSNMLNGILRNLISNAIKFTRENGKISISAEDKGDFVQVSIADTGIGMDEEMTSQIFKVGEKTSRPGTAGESSTGLGLILVKEYVNRNGGNIWVESKENIGTTFIFTMPKNTKA